MAFPIAAVLGLGAKLIDKFIPDPEAKAKAQLELLRMQQEGDLKELDAATQAIVAEAKSESWLASNWRPITMLTFVAIIANNYIIAPYTLLLFDVSVQLQIPPDMWDLLKLGLSGYVMGRSGEKIVKAWKGRE